MQDLRSEIRAAFEREQAAHPPIGGLRSHLVSAASAQPTQAPTRQWLALVAAIVLGALVAGALLSSRLARNPTPAGDYGPPPAGVNLIYVHDPDHPTWLTGYDWNGNPRGTVKLQDEALGAFESIDMAPNGQQFYVPGPPPRLLDRLGKPLQSSVGPNDLYAGVWADDNQHRCATDITARGWVLGPPIPGRSANFVNLPKPVTLGTTVIACSIRSDRAILLGTLEGPVASGIWVVKLSDGSIIAHHSYDPSLGLRVVASSDASYIAESSPDASLGVPTVIRQVSDWRTVATLNASDKVLHFSGDGSEVLVTPTHPTQYGPVHLATMNWVSGQTLWTYDGTDWPWTVVARPGGQDFALEMDEMQKVGGPCPPTNPCVAPPPTRVILIVHGDGKSQRLPGRFYPTW